jgi:ComF family protein
MRFFTQFFLNLVMPTNCVVCTKEGTFLCPECTIRLLSAPPSTNPHLYARFNYKDPRVQKLLWQYKYGRVEVLAPLLAESLLDNRAITSILKNAQLLAPIPTTRARERNRGFNQTKSLAEALAKTLPHLTVTGPEVLVRNKQSIAQTKTKNRKERWKNAAQSFSVLDHKPIEGKHIVIIDDITTTGATLHYARLVLLEKGAQSVHGIAIARHGR